MNLKPWLLGAAGGVFVLAATSLAFDRSLITKVASKGSANVEASEDPPNREGKGANSFAPVIKKVSRSVVNISTSKTVKQSPMSPFFSDPFFRRFFGDPGEDESGGGGSGRRPNRRQTSLGSGVIVTKDGYILTNNHVVDEADEIKVAMSNKKEYTAKVVGKDSRTDVAVLKIEVEDVPFATLANSEKVEVGDLVFAIGNPFGLSQTVTMGIVSALGRGNLGIEEYEDFIQTDAAINPGNSGGGLFDAEGRLVGINTAIFSRTGGNQGIGFAIPVNLARYVLDRLVKDGKVDRGYLGVLIQELTPALAEGFNVPAGKGALIGQVVEGSAADKAGIKRGDVILEVDGKTVKDDKHLRFTISQMAPGSTVKIKLVRKGEEKTVEATLKTLPDDPAAGRLGPGESSNDALDGVTVGDLEPGVRSQLRLPASLKGAFVAQVDESSAAFEAGLRRGDVIMEINQERVTSADEAVQVCKKIQNKRILLLVYSRGGSHYVVVDEAKKK